MSALGRLAMSSYNDGLRYIVGILPIHVLVLCLLYETIDSLDVPCEQKESVLGV